MTSRRRDLLLLLYKNINVLLLFICVCQIMCIHTDTNYLKKISLSALLFIDVDNENWKWSRASNTPNKQRIYICQFMAETYIFSSKRKTLTCEFTMRDFCARWVRARSFIVIGKEKYKYKCSENRRSRKSHDDSPFRLHFYNILMRHAVQWTTTTTTNKHT